MGGIFHLLREMTYFTSQQTSFPMELLGAREGGRGRSGKCKSKTARAKLLAFSEQPLINCSLQELVEIKDTFIFKAGLIAWWLALHEAYTSANKQSATPSHIGQCLWAYSKAITHAFLFIYSVKQNHQVKSNYNPTGTSVRIPEQSLRLHSTGYQGQPKEKSPGMLNKRAREIAKAPGPVSQWEVVTWEQWAKRSGYEYITAMKKK